MSAAKVILAFPWDKRNGIDNDVDPTVLNEEVAKVASKELREDELIREQSLQQFREWISKTEDIQNCRTDSNFLLRFLRVKKFSVPMAEQMLMKYLNLRQTLHHLCQNLDITNPNVNQLITDGYIYVSPFRDDHGRRVIIYDTQKLDPFKYSSADQSKAHMLTYEALLDDEESQVLGFTHIADVSHISAAHVTMWSPNEFATVIKWGEHSLPMRHKEVHWLGLPSVLAWLREFVMGRFSPKIKNRFFTDINVADLHKRINPSALPKEYGGTMPMNEMIELWKKELMDKREKILALDEMRLLSDKGITSHHTASTLSDNALNTAITSLPGSFRRLEVD